MRHEQFIGRVKSAPKDKQEHYKKALVHLIAYHTDNKPDAIESSMRAKDGFAEKKINSIYPSVMSEIYKTALQHGDIKGKK